jgi:hypothetical protein
VVERLLPLAKRLQIRRWVRAGFTVEAQMLIDLDESAPRAILFARQPQRIST